MIGDVLWQPGDDAMSTTNLGSFIAWLAEHRGLHFDDYDALRVWSVTEVEQFWAAAWEFLGVRSLRPDGESDYDAVLSSRRMRPTTRRGPGGAAPHAHRDRPATARRSPARPARPGSGR